MPSMFRSHHGRAYAAGTRAVKSRQEERDGARFNRQVVPSLNRNKARCAVQLLGSAWPGMEQVGLSPTRPSPYVPPNGQRIMLVSFR
jgi:hypothetical protein